ncbi:TfoX/Sxy family protein [Candidatus Gracilibacteria bacterium]|nr:TfoX/Sxy family protein [Candidatus Gracilibacteria bacterium]MCF7898366.1 TfoX/Sxy family protein [Candidatus Paceibacterota bacterium]
MKTNPFLEYIIYDVFGEVLPITFRAMMGAYILYYEGKAFAIVEKDELYFKGSEELSNWYMSRGSKQFMYLRKEEETYLDYFSVPPEVYEDKIMLEEWLGVALSVAKPPKPRKKKKVS